MENPVPRLFATASRSITSKCCRESDERENIRSAVRPVSDYALKIQDYEDWKLEFNQVDLNLGLSRARWSLSNS